MNKEDINKEDMNTSLDINISPERQNVVNESLFKNGRSSVSPKRSNMGSDIQ